MFKVRFNRGERGFSLPEVLMSTAIFGVVGVTFVTALSTNVNVLYVADQRTTAESLARAQLEAINNAAYDSTSPYEYTTVSDVPAGYGININVELIDPDTGTTSATDLGIQKVTVTVTCDQRSVPEVLTVEAYKR